MKTYTPILQLPFCCVAACLQCIFYAENYPILDQEDIATQLGLRIPYKMTRYFENKKNLITYVPDISNDKGTQIFCEDYSIKSFFERNNLPFCISKEIVPKSEKELKSILEKTPKSDHIILRLHSNILGENPGNGHMVLFQNIKQAEFVLLGDPTPPFHKTISLHNLWQSMNNAPDNIIRGLFIVRKIS